MGSLCCKRSPASADVPGPTSSVAALATVDASMWLVKLSDFMMMTGPPPPFEEWQPGFFVIFVSHEWLGRDHPDAEGHEQCMPLFVERCPLFVILAPKLHNSQQERCSYESYGRRGWCRAEIWFKQMRTKPQDVPMILITGDQNVKFLRAHNWVYNMVHDGLFSVPGDRELLKPVMGTLLQSKMEEFLLQGKLHYFRYFKSRTLA
eukprot:s297_g6.t1